MQKILFIYGYRSWGAKVSMLTHAMHTYTKLWGRLKWPSAITRLTTHFTCSLVSDLVICKQRKEYDHIWHRMSLLRPAVVKQRKLKLHSFKSALKWAIVDFDSVNLHDLPCFRMDCYKCITESLEYLLSISQAHPQAPSVPRSPGPPPPQDPNVLSNTDAARYVSYV